MRAGHEKTLPCMAATSLLQCKACAGHAVKVSFPVRLRNVTRASLLSDGNVAETDSRFFIGFYWTWFGAACIGVISNWCYIKICVTPYKDRQRLLFCLKNFVFWLIFRLHSVNIEKMFIFANKKKRHRGVAKAGLWRPVERWMSDVATLPVVWWKYRWCEWYVIFLSQDWLLTYKATKIEDGKMWRVALCENATVTVVLQLLCN